MQAGNFMSNKALERKGGGANWYVVSKTIDLLPLSRGKHSRSWSSMDRSVVSLGSLVV